MQNETWKTLLLLGIGLYVAKIWLDDFRARKAGTPNPRALPGAFPTPGLSIVVAALGGFLIVGAETWGELRLGIAGEQGKMSVLFALYTLVAAVVEEIIFRGYIVIDKKGSAWLWLSVLGASVLFAGLHPFLWQWEGGMPWSGGRLLWTLNVKGWFSTAAVFVSSLWFYFVRFNRLNRNRSLLPCFAAHAAKNLGVIGIKAAQGFLVGFW